MRTRRFGHTNLYLPVIGQGTWYLESAEDAVDMLRFGIEQGLTHIDTAEMYGGGRAEEVVGQAISGRRHQIQLVSKVLPSNASEVGTISACEASLKRLGTDYLDVYLLHWPGSIPFEETMAGFERLVDAGKIRYFGVSNFDLDDLQSLEQVVDPRRLACNQVLYHATERTVENNVHPWCRNHEIPIVAYSPFGHDGLRALTPRVRELLDEIAWRANVTVYQVVLAFLTREPDVFAIPKAARQAHITDNAAAGRLELTVDEIMALEATLPRSPAGSRLGML